MSQPANLLRLEELTMPALDALDRERTLLALPVSPLEEHGPHLPLGQDGFMARAMGAVGRSGGRAWTRRGA